MRTLLLITILAFLPSCSAGERRPLSDAVAAPIACEMYAKRELFGANGLTFADSERASVTQPQPYHFITRIYAERKDGGGRQWFTCVMTKRPNGDFYVDAFSRS